MKDKDITTLRLYLKEIPFQVLAEGKFSNYDEFATRIQNKIKSTIVDFKKGRL